MQSILDAIPMAALLVDPSERIVMANKAADRLLGGDMIGRPVITKLRQPAVGAALDRALRGETPTAPAQFDLQAQSETVMARAHVSPIAPQPSLPQGGALIAIEDVTALETAGAQRRDFVANVSHELRTPLTALLGFIETLRVSAKDDPAARERFLEIMEREAKRMTRLVADLLSLSRVESDERRRPEARVDLDQVLRGAFQSLGHIAEAQNVDLIRAGEAGPLVVRGDPDQLTQIFANLIENGIKYGGAGGKVTVRAETIAHEPALRGAAVRITVADQGDGIDPIHIPRLTERFYRIDSHRSREQGGTGLGLAIVKHIINRHRGRLKIDSEKGKGARFSVTLPKD